VHRIGASCDGLVPGAIRLTSGRIASAPGKQQAHQANRRRSGRLARIREIVSICLSLTLGRRGGHRPLS